MAYDGDAERTLTQLNSQAGRWVKVLPWVIGVRGIFDVAGITRGFPRSPHTEEAKPVKDSVELQWRRFFQPGARAARRR